MRSTLRRRSLESSAFSSSSRRAATCFRCGVRSATISSADASPSRAVRAGDAAAALPPGMAANMQAALTAKEPPTKQQLGHCTWTLLHRLAAQFPAEPTADDQATITTFFTLFGQLYPCHECAEHFRGMLAEYPPDTRSNLHLSQWLCSLHNVVNERVGNPTFECTKEGLQERWGDCGCFDKDEDEAAAR
mmetsp:Transcript_22960/g.80122  ORF Transcript_22960/g.80122 Transcript_22960/m.80122 type:complete len:190 (+) Transcript_22960:6462-7031(+)